MTEQYNDKHEIRFLCDLQRLIPQPGDVFVITTELHLSMEQRHVIIALWENVMPGHKVLMLDGGLKIGIIGDTPEPHNVK